MDTVQEIRRLCRLSSTLWVDGDGAGARKALRAAQHLALAGSAAATSQEHDAWNRLRFEVLAAAGRLFLRAEEPAKALLTCQVALQMLERIDQPGQFDRFGRAAELDLRVTYATEAVNQAPDAAARQALIEELDAVTDECLAASEELPDHGEITGRAVNNALLLRLRPLHEARDISDPETQVRAWLWVGQARRAISAANMPESGLQPVNRQVVDLARRLGSWERAWEAVTQSLHSSYQRNEKVSLLAKAALLAWEHGNRPDAITYGTTARTASIAVDLPWVRVYAYQAGVVAAAAGAGSVPAALTAYRTCVDLAGHATRPGRAWETAQVVLDAGYPAGETRDFLRDVGFGEEATTHQRSFAAVILSDHEDDTAPEQNWDNVDVALLTAPDRARFHLAAARSAVRRGHKNAAAVHLNQGHTYLLHWPGLTATAYRQAAIVLSDTAPVTPAQQKVLNLLVEGMPNEAIATTLGISPRTVAVHLQALLHRRSAASRTELATQELRRQLLTSD
jgi:DNA-binding NarL/FixJ family response regulator